jgi:hypothetical protein
MNFFRKKPIITFSCDEKFLNVFPKPIPASEARPKWFRRMRQSASENDIMGTIKRCVPFRDAMDMGYILPLWIDINVQTDESNVNFTYIEDFLFPTFSNHFIEQIKGCPIENTPFGNQPMKLHNPWMIETAPGWSCLFIQPINHFDNKLHIITGVVDTDSYTDKINFPFIWMDKEFNGCIKKGTPVVQVIPFKRIDIDSVVTLISEESRKSAETINRIGRSVIKNGYKLNWWKPKKFK